MGLWSRRSPLNALLSGCSPRWRTLELIPMDLIRAGTCSSAHPGPARRSPRLHPEVPRGTGGAPSHLRDVLASLPALGKELGGIFRLIWWEALKGACFAGSQSKGDAPRPEQGWVCVLGHLQMVLISPKLLPNDHPGGISALAGSRLSPGALPEPCPGTGNTGNERRGAGRWKRGA